MVGKKRFKSREDSGGSSEEDVPKHKDKKQRWNGGSDRTESASEPRPSTSAQGMSSGRVRCSRDRKKIDYRQMNSCAQSKMVQKRRSEKEIRRGDSNRTFQDANLSSNNNLKNSTKVVGRQRSRSNLTGKRSKTVFGRNNRSFDSQVGDKTKEVHSGEMTEVVELTAEGEDRKYPVSRTLHLSILIEQKRRKPEFICFTCNFSFLNFKMLSFLAGKQTVLHTLPWQPFQAKPMANQGN